MERLRRSARLAGCEERLNTDFGSNADFHMSRTKRIINDNHEVMLMYESASKSMNRPRSPRIKIIFWMSTLAPIPNNIVWNRCKSTHPRDDFYSRREILKRTLKRR